MGGGEEEGEHKRDRYVEEERDDEERARERPGRSVD